MLDTANILADRQPRLYFVRIKWFVAGLAGKTDEVPAGVGECIQRVGFAARRFLTIGAFHMLPGRVAIKRVARHVETDILWQDNRQLRTRHRQHAAELAVDNRNRRAPIALAADTPVTQAVLRLPLAPAFDLGFRDDGSLGVIDVHPIHPIAVHDQAGAGIGNIAVKIAIDQIAIGDHAAHGQIIFARKIQIALVMRGAAKDRTSAIIHQHEIGDIDGQMPTGI